MAGAGYSVPSYAYALNNPLAFTDPSGRNVEMFCETIDGHGSGGKLGRHCYLRVSTSPDSTYDNDETVEIYGPNGDRPTAKGGQYCSEYGQPMRQLDNPYRDAKALPVMVWGHQGAATDACVFAAFESQARTLPIYYYTGPNSSTFARNMVLQCGLGADFSFNAPFDGMFSGPQDQWPKKWHL